MKTLRGILDDLTSEDRRTLEYAFEHGLSQAVKLPESEVSIGVNMQQDSAYTILEQVGVWCLRERKQNGKDDA